MIAANVVDLIGPPIAKNDEYEGWSFLGIGAHLKQWCYGTYVCLENIFIVDPFLMVRPLPINLRWYRYTDDDPVIDWYSKEPKLSRYGKGQHEVGARQQLAKLLLQPSLSSDWTLSFLRVGQSRGQVLEKKNFKEQYATLMVLLHHWRWFLMRRR